MKNTVEILSIQDKESAKNSWYRAPKQTPTIKKVSDELIEVRTVDDIAEISKLEETILNIIATFKFSPFWLVQQWFYSYIHNNGFDEVSKWINVGLVWAETTSMGIFLRPTRFLLDMFKLDVERFLEIPFGLLNHTCAEQQLIFDITMGNKESELWLVIQEEETIPVYHPLGLEFESELGTTAIRESDFRIGFKRYNPEQLLQMEHEIEIEVKNKAKFSKEFSDFSRFPIIKKNENGELVSQTPDIIIPIPRKDGNPKSFAIEIELTAKQQDKYTAIMNNYKDNIKFGKLFYLCGSQKIANLVKNSFKTVGGLGKCELFLLPFTPPQQRLLNYSEKDEIEQSELIKKTEVSTNNA